MKYLSVLVLLVAAQVLPAHRSEAGQGQAASLRGVVVARATRQPIADATVTLDGAAATTTTNGLGRFELSSPSASGTLVVRAPGYVELRVPVAQAQEPLTI